MTEKDNSKPYDLEDRTLTFAKSVRGFVKKLNKTVPYIEDGKQLVRASGSVGGSGRDIWVGVTAFCVEKTSRAQPRG
jgi:hypothetical protein